MIKIGHIYQNNLDSNVTRKVIGFSPCGKYAECERVHSNGVDRKYYSIRILGKLSHYFKIDLGKGI